MNQTIMKAALHRRAILSGAAALSLTGCGSLKDIVGPGPAPQLYVLKPAMPQAGNAPAVKWQLSVATPQAAAGIDTTRIALSRSLTTMDYFANAAWTDRVPFLMQGAMVQAFESTGKIVAVQRDTSGIGADYLLQSELRDFEAQYDPATEPSKDAKDAPSPPPKVTVQMECKLLVVPEHKILQSRVFTRDAAAARNDLDSIVTAFNGAVSGLLQDLVDWALRAPPIG
jgi:cholesterol transport system auxiliary component